MLRLLIIVIFLAVLIVFALSNTDIESIWLISFGWHLSVGTLVLGIGVVGIVFGIFVGWIGELRQRKRARRAETHIRTLESQIVDLHQRLDRAQTSSPGAVPSTSEPRI